MEFLSNDDNYNIYKYIHVVYIMIKDHCLLIVVFQRCVSSNFNIFNNLSVTFI